MDTFLKRYKIRLRTLAPLFIGSGQEISKKEYVFDKNKNLIYVIDPNKLMNKVRSKNLTDSYLAFMQGFYGQPQNNRGGDEWKNKLAARYASTQRQPQNNKKGGSASRGFPPATLREWLSNNNIRNYDELSAYTLKGVENVDDRKSLKAIQMFIKDAYNQPYIPGSSLKGLLRSIILWHEVGQRANLDYVKARRIEAEDAEKNFYRAKELKQKLAAVSDKMERGFFNRKIDGTDTSIMRGLIVSDSRPLSLGDLVLCGKNDYSPSGTKKTINIFRECIRPDRDIEFDLTMDSRIFAPVKGGEYTADSLRKMISSYSRDYYDLITYYFPEGQPHDPDTVFLGGGAVKEFREDIEREYNDPDTVFLGGGAGYFSKTVSYKLFEREKAVEFVRNYLEKTTPREHAHGKDGKISPHMQKCTGYDREVYEMGKCRIEINEI